MRDTSTRETNVLIAEDDDDDFVVFSLAIAETKVAVALSRAENGEILMRVLGENIPDILFLDISMPCKDGRACLREIRSNKRYDGLPVIIYSSFSDLETIEYCFREGSNLFTVKPYNLSDLARTLKRILTVDWKRTMYYPPKSEFVIHPLSPDKLG